MFLFGLNSPFSVFQYTVSQLRAIDQLQDVILVKFLIYL